MGALNQLYATAGDAAGVDPSHFKLLTCFILSYPLGSIFVRIPKNQPAVKHAFSIAVTLWFLVGMLDLWGGTLHVVGSALFTYIMAATVKGRVMPWTVFVVVMSDLLLSHWIRSQMPTDVVEISGPQMVLTMKLSTFAWNVFDGHQKLESLDESQKETRIPKLPSLLEYFGYVFYFPAFLVGPSLTYTDYMALVNETLYEGAKTDPNGSKRVPAGRKRVAYQKLFLGLIALGLYAVYGSKFNYTVMLTSWWTAKPIWYRVLFTQLIGLTQRIKYYGAWYLTEGACIFTGYGFNGFDKKTGAPKWDKAANVDVLNIEFCPNFKILLDSWNINTNVWLRNSVYKRLVPQGKKPTGLTTMLTFMTSALWHGIYSGYYLTFFAGGLVSSAARSVRTYIRPLFLPALLPAKSKVLPPPTLVKRAYDIAGTVTSMVILNYIVAPFMLLTWRESIQAWNTLYWYGHVVVIAWLVWGNALGGFKILSKRIKARVARAESKAEAQKEQLKLEEREKAFANGTMTPTNEGSLMVAPVDAAMHELDVAVKANGFNKAP